MGRIVLVLASLFFCQLSVTLAAQVHYIGRQCVDTGLNVTQGSVYETNLNLLFDSFRSKSSSVKFYNYTLGDAPNKVYGLFQCRQDLSIDNCKECMKEAIRGMLPEVCPSYGEGTVWYYECMLRYANRTIFSLSESSGGLNVHTTATVDNYAEFAPILASEINGVIEKASSAFPHFASGENDYTLFKKLYTFAQCTPDIDVSECKFCLEKALSNMIDCCNASLMTYVLVPSCQLRYDREVFLNETYLSTPVDKLESPVDKQENTNSPVRSSKPSLNSTVIAAIVVCVSVGLLAFAVVLWMCLCRKKTKQGRIDVAPASPMSLHSVTAKNDEESLGESNFVQYDFNTLKFATRDFSNENMLGKGGFGIVYKGTLENGEKLAIKRLSGATSGQGTKEFMTEARLLAKLQHKNLVKLVGFCSEGDEKLLVYEFLSNSSLDRFLFDQEKRPFLDWTIRNKIIMGIARGLQYLHEDSRLTIIHRDLKPGNILLDKEMNPKIADFGLAKLFGAAQTFGNTSRIAGTLGYMSPEYIITGEYSDKSDVYSFGIMLLEIVSGQSNIKFYHLEKKEDLAVHAWRLWNEGRPFDLIDSALNSGNNSNNDMIRCIQIGLLCLQPTVEQRPTMASVIYMLTGSVELSLPSTPAMSFPQFNMPLSAMTYSTGQQSDIDQYSTKSITQDLDPKPR